MKCDINNLIRNLSTEDAAIFSLLAADGWKIEVEEGGESEAGQYVWRIKTSASDEIHGPFESDEEVIRAAHELYKQSTKGKPAHSNDTPPPEKAAETHKLDADEQDLLDDVFKFLEAHGASPRRSVQCGRWVADIVTVEAVYNVRYSLTPETLPPIVRETADCCNEVDENQTLDAVIVTSDCEGLEALKDIGDERTVYVVTLEELSDRFDEPPAPVAGESLFPSDDISGAGVLVQQMLPSRLSTHPSLLMRANGLDPDHVAELEAGYRAGRTYPPADIFFDGEHHWVADGNHRAAGAAKAGAPLDVHIHKGTLRDAILFALRANTEHGLKLTNDDKRLKAVTILCDPDWFKESDSRLAEIANVTQPFISGVRRDLARLIPELQTVEAEGLKLLQDDASFASHLNLAEGLVRVVRRLPEAELERLTQNVLGDDGRRRGTDGVVRTVQAKTAGEEQEASLFTAEEASATPEAEASAKTDENAAAAPAAPAATAVDVDESGADVAVIDEDISTPLTAAGWELVRADDREGVKFYAKNSRLNLVTGMYGTSKEACDEARRKQLEYEAQQTKTAGPEPPPPFDAHFGVTMKNAGWELHREGRRFHATNKKLQMATILFDTAQQVIDDAVQQQDRYERDEKEKVQKQAEEEKRQAAENLLKDRDLTVTYTFMKELPGEVTVAVRLDEDAEGMEMETLDISKVRPFPEAVLEMITNQVSRPARKHKASATAPSAAKIAASKKSPAKKPEVTRTKTMSKKTAGKQPASRAGGGAAKKVAAKKAGASTARVRK